MKGVGLGVIRILELTSCFKEERVMLGTTEVVLLERRIREERAPFLRNGAKLADCLDRASY